ncbi:hypothetical protein MMC25_006161 [Agyrium rufum]|nr:hypothetical protein [Agyrium rufum]
MHRFPAQYHPSPFAVSCSAPSQPSTNPIPSLTTDSNPTDHPLREGSPLSATLPTNIAVQPHADEAPAEFEENPAIHTPESRTEEDTTQQQPQQRRKRRRKKPKQANTLQQRAIVEYPRIQTSQRRTFTAGVLEIMDDLRGTRARRTVSGELGVSMGEYRSVSRELGEGDPSVAKIQDIGGTERHQESGEAGVVETQGAGQEVEAAIVYEHGSRDDIVVETLDIDCSAVEGRATEILAETVQDSGMVASSAKHPGEVGERYEKPNVEEMKETVEETSSMNKDGN